MALELQSDSFRPEQMARDLLLHISSAALGTLDSAGAPFVSYVTTAAGPDGSPLLLLSALAQHTRNVRRDPRASLLFVREPAAGAEALAAIRLTLTGHVSQDENPASRERFLSAHPEAGRYSQFSDFSLYRFHVESGHLVAGFGRIASLGPGDLIIGP